MKVVGRILGYLSILVHLGLGLFLLGIGWIGSGVSDEMHIDLIPVAPESMATTLIVCGILAVLSALLAVRQGKIARLPLVLWSLAVCAVFVGAFTRSSYRFDGEEHMRLIVWLLLGSLLLAAGSISRSRAGGR